MHWFRSNLRLGLGLALVALTVQIALSLVHAHFGSIDKTLASVVAVQSGQPPATSPDTSPPAPKPSGPADNYCPLCALIQLASISLPSAAPALALPVDNRRISLEPGIEFTFSASPHRLFLARAPPLA